MVQKMDCGVGFFGFQVEVFVEDSVLFMQILMEVIQILEVLFINQVIVVVSFQSLQFLIVNEMVDIQVLVVVVRFKLVFKVQNVIIKGLNGVYDFFQVYNVKDVFNMQFKVVFKF